MGYYSRTTVARRKLYTRHFCSTFKLLSLRPCSFYISSNTLRTVPFENLTRGPSLPPPHLFSRRKTRKRGSIAPTSISSRSVQTRTWHRSLAWRAFSQNVHWKLHRVTSLDNGKVSRSARNRPRDKRTENWTGCGGNDACEIQRGREGGQLFVTRFERIRIDDDAVNYPWEPCSLNRRALKVNLPFTVFHGAKFALFAIMNYW